MMPTNWPPAHFELRIKELPEISKDRPMTLIAVQQYARAANLFIYISERIDQALGRDLYIDENFAWGTLRQCGEVLHKLEPYLFGPLPSRLTSGLECLLMVTGKSRKGRRATAKKRHLQLADRKACNET
jgi:hypothetical protein